MDAYCEQAPPASHVRSIECAWSMQTGGSVTAHRVPPDGCLDIVYADSLNAVRNYKAKP